MLFIPLSKTHYTVESNTENLEQLIYNHNKTKHDKMMHVSWDKQYHKYHI